MTEISECKLCNEPLSYSEEKCNCKETVCLFCNKTFFTRRSKICVKCSKIPIWKQLKMFINNFKNNEVITRQSILRTIGRGYELTLDTYRHQLTTIGILEYESRGKYIKRKDIPNALTTTLLRDMVKNSWKTWFMPLDRLDEINTKK